MAVEGRLLDVADNGHSMHWFLYDEAGRIERGKELAIPEHAIETLRQFLETVDPYVRNLKHDDATPFGIELSVPPGGQEIAAIINTDNLRRLTPRKIVFCRRSGQPPHFIPISPQI
jgi:hypothetical protein